VILFIFDQQNFLNYDSKCLTFLMKILVYKKKYTIIVMKQVMINMHILDKKKFLFKMILSNIDISA
jgi:hypothetical protein